MDRAVRAWALASVTVLCSWARHLSLVHTCDISISASISTHSVNRGDASISIRKGNLPFFLCLCLRRCVASVNRDNANASKACTCDLPYWMMPLRLRMSPCAYRRCEHSYTYACIISVNQALTLTVPTIWLIPSRGVAILLLSFMLQKPRKALVQFYRFSSVYFYSTLVYIYIHVCIINTCKMIFYLYPCHFPVKCSSKY